MRSTLPTPRKVGKVGKELMAFELKLSAVELIPPLSDANRCRRLPRVGRARLRRLGRPYRSDRRAQLSGREWRASPCYPFGPRLEPRSPAESCRILDGNR